MGKYIQLSRGFMLIGIFGFLISLIFITQYSLDWGTTLTIFFGFIFLASLISTEKGDYNDKEIDKELAIHEKKLKKN
ncbi:MAG: hypothetical protein QXG00_04025 [Candidatus Woesearchaeota archaeon]